MATQVLSRAPSTASQKPSSIRSQKPPLPHVSTLWQSVELSANRNTFDARKTLSSQRPSKQRSTPSSPQNTSLDLRNTPNIHLLAMPDNGPGEFRPAKHRRNTSSGVHSPSSTHNGSIHNGSIFELPTMPNESPNSSIRTSFLAELEDTSGLDYSPVPPMPTQLAPPTDTSILFKTNKLTSRAILKVVDETIAGIEAANRELLARAEAAEASAYRLHVSNTELRSRVEELSVHYRPKTAPVMKSMGTQTSPRNTPRHTPHTSVDRNGSPVLLDRAIPGPLDKFAAREVQEQPQIASEPETPTEPEREPKPKSRRSIRSLKFLHRHHAEAFSMPNSNASTTTLNQTSKSRASSDRPRTADAATGPSHPVIPPVPDLPIFLSLTSHATGTGAHARKHTRTISFEEAKKLAALQVPTPQGKPLPVIGKNPLGEMSPSPIHGIVEIGLGIQEGDEKEGEVGQTKPLKSQRSRVRFLLKETMIRELLEGAGDKEKKRERKREKEENKENKENKGEKSEEKRKMSGFWKRGKKGEEAVVAVA